MRVEKIRVFGDASGVVNRQSDLSKTLGALALVSKASGLHSLCFSSTHAGVKYRLACMKTDKIVSVFMCCISSNVSQVVCDSHVVKVDV